MKNANLKKPWVSKGKRKKKKKLEPNPALRCDELMWNGLCSELNCFESVVHLFEFGDLSLVIWAMQETWVRFLGWEDPLEKGRATHSSIPAWRIPTEELGELQFMGSQRVGHDWATQQNGDTDMEKRLMDTGSGGGRRGWDVRREAWSIYIIIYKIDSQWEFAVWLKELNVGLCNNLKGWDGEVGGSLKREGTYVYLWLVHVDVWQKGTQYCREIILQLKINKFNCRKIILCIPKLLRESGS